MEDVSNLSREELIRLLQNKKEGETKSQETNRKISRNDSSSSKVGHSSSCLYKPIRANQKPCEDPSDTPWGYCKKHKKTAQSRKAEDVYREQREKEEAEKQVDDETRGKRIAETIISELDDELNRLDSEDEEQISQDMEKVQIRKRLNEQRVKTSTGKKEHPQKSKPKTPSRPVAKKVVKKPVTRKKILRRNLWGRFEDNETHILFDPKTRCAYGVQDPTGAVHSLSGYHISVCKKNGWNYTVCEESSSEESSSEESSSEEESEEEEEEESEEEESEEEESEEEESSEEEEEEEEESSDEDSEDEENEEESDEEEEDSEEEESYEDSEEEYDDDEY